MIDNQPQPMRPQDWFGVALRTLGVWTLLKAMTYALSEVGERNNWFSSGTSAAGYFYYGLADFIAGLILLLGADFIVGLAYRAPRRNEQPDQVSTSVSMPADREKHPNGRDE